MERLIVYCYSNIVNVCLIKYECFVYMYNCYDLNLLIR